MESRNISLTLEKAKEWYNSGSADLKKIVLQAYTENELKTVHFSEIKSFEDACKALKIDDYEVSEHLELFYISFPKSLCDHLAAIYKLDIICKALNRDWKPNLTNGTLYHPNIRFYLSEDKAREVAKSNDWKVCQSFYADGKKYFLVGGSYEHWNEGMSYFSFGYRYVSPYLSLLGCKSKEIAEHMSTYFAKEIFEACYAHHVGMYKWIK